VLSVLLVELASALQLVVVVVVTYA
jgi:hypothetical protein